MSIVVIKLLAKHRATKMRPNAIRGDIFGRFANFDRYRPEVARDVISGVVVDPTGLKVHVKFGDSIGQTVLEIRLPHFVTNSGDNDDAGRRIL